MKRLGLLLIALATVSLAACGGGGGSSLPPTSGGGGTQSSAKLSAGFLASGGSTTTSSHRIDLMARPMDTLGGSIVPFAQFWVPDSYVPANTFPVVGYQAVAYVSGPTPSPIPAVSFTQTGVNMPFLGTSSTLSESAAVPSGDTFIGAEMVGTPSQIGQTIVTVTAISQSVQVTGDTYAGLLLTATSNGGVNLNGPSGLLFSASGGAATTGTADLSIDTSQSVSALQAPHGIIEVQGQTINQVTAANYVSANATSEVRDANLCNSGTTDTFIFQTAAGLLVKFQPISLAGPNVAAGTCTWTNILGMYEVAGVSGFPF